MASKLHLITPMKYEILIRWASTRGNAAAGGRTLSNTYHSLVIEIAGDFHPAITINLTN